MMGTVKFETYKQTEITSGKFYDGHLTWEDLRNMTIQELIERLAD